ncbi:MAG: D-aminoacylase [Gammaproteobacteria bacterium]|nr:MAG: D-aminoacylase [Gammaproteobacteria bacterium]
MHDLIIRGGTIVDGTGSSSFIGDIAIDDGKITAVGQVSEDAREIIDAEGLLVTPGWVDTHTHYDGQATWDPLLTPSGWHGVTTAIMGNCGVGFAPVAPDHRDWMIDLMESVEDISADALKAGIDWQWVSFPEYLDALDRMPRAINVGSYVGHCALRTFVMGERGAQDEDPTEAETQQMADLMSEAMEAGALGFSTSRTAIHLTPGGDPIPGTFAKEAELMAIANAVGSYGNGGLVEVIAAGVETGEREIQETEIALMSRLSLESGCAVTYLTAQIGKDPDLWRESFRLAEEANAAGAMLIPQVSCRPVGMLFSFESENPFARFPSFIELKGQPQPDRLAALRDPEVKARILADKDPALTAWTQLFANPWPLTFELGEVPDYEPDPDTNIKTLSEKQGREPAELAYELMLKNDGQAFLFCATAGFSDGNLDATREMLLSSTSMVGGSDGGAHCNFIVDAGVPTFMLTHWARDRKDGLPLEMVVRKQTSDTARRNGITDRGELLSGQRADINLIDLEKLTSLAPLLVNDLPAGGSRLIQRAEGYVATLVSGQVIMKNGEDTGARPGSVVRLSQMGR